MYSSRILVEAAALLGGLWPTLIYLVGLILSLLALSLVGSVALQWLGISWHKRAGWAFLISIGLIVSVLYFLARSLLSKIFLFIPGAFPGEITLLSLALIVPVWSEYRASVRHFLLDSVHRAYGLIFIIGLLLYGWVFLLRPVPISSDPGVISGFLEVYRNQGQIPFRISDANPAMINYPFGFMTLLWSYTNPLLSSLAAVQIWPSLSYSLAVGLIVEFVIQLKQLDPKRAVLVYLGLIFFAKACWLGEVYVLWPFQEGVAKKSLYMPVVLGLIIAYWLWQKEDGETLYYQWALLWLISFASMMMPFAVNPANFALSGALVMTTLFALLFKLISKRSWKRIYLMVGVCMLYLLITCVQDPLLLSRLSNQIVCFGTYQDLIAKCGMPHIESWQKLSQIGAPPVNKSLLTLADWKSLLPTNLIEPLNLFFPISLRLVENVASPFLVFVFFLVSVSISPYSKRKISLRNIGNWLAVTATLLLIYSALTAFQIWLFFHYVEPSHRRLITSYTEQSYFNLYTPLILLMVACATAQLAQLYQEHCFQSKRSSSAFGSGTVLGLSLFFGFMCFLNYPTIMKIRSKLGKTSTTRLAEFHRGALAVKRLVGSQFGSKSNSPKAVFIPATPLEINDEHWIFADYRSFALATIGGYETYNTFSPLARPEPLTNFEIYKRACSHFCDVAAEQRISFFLADSKAIKCGIPVKEWLKSVKGCTLAMSNNFPDSENTIILRQFIFERSLAQ